MANATLVSVNEYLHTSFEDGDREYLDGVIVERSLGEKKHSRSQKKLIGFFIANDAALKTFCFPGQRVQVAPTRFRIPDVCVYIGQEPDEEIFHTPPFLAIEILSKDGASDLQEKIDDYLAFGVPYVWVIDPRRLSGIVHTREASREARDGMLRTENPAIELPIAQIFD
ncbi:MAG: Uma2 family endonuclease [Bryobacteraceae bacterium]